MKIHKRNNKRHRFQTLDEFLAITRAFCPGATDDWLKPKFDSLSPIQCYDLLRKEQRIAAQPNAGANPIGGVEMKTNKDRKKMLQSLGDIVRGGGNPPIAGSATCSAHRTGDTRPCEACRGMGFFFVRKPPRQRNVWTPKDCAECKGTGRRASVPPELLKAKHR